MSFWTKILEKVKNNEDFVEITSSSFKDLLNGNILSKKFIKKQYPFLLFISVFVIFYISNRIVCERQMDTITQLKKRQQDVRYESLTISSELTKLSRRTYVLDYTERHGIGLKESFSPPVVVEYIDPKTETSIKKENEEHRKATKKIEKATDPIEE